MDRTEGEVDELSTAVDRIAQFEAALTHNGGIGLTPDSCTTWLARIRRDCARLPELPALLAAIARPLLDNLLSTWKPLLVSSISLSFTPNHITYRVHKVFALMLDPV